MSLAEPIPKWPTAEALRGDAAMRLVERHAEFASGCAYFNPDTRREIERLCDAAALDEYDRAFDDFCARYDDAYEQVLESPELLEAALFAAILEYLSWLRRERESFRFALARRAEAQKLSAASVASPGPWSRAESGRPILDVVALPVLRHAPPAGPFHVPTIRTRALAA